MKEPVLTKADFVRRYELGEFGNHSPTWKNVLQFIYDSSVNPKGRRLFHLRNRIVGGPTYYNLTADELVALVANLRGLDPEDVKNFYISEMCPTEKTVLQGEVCLGCWGYNLTYTRVAKPMRDALCEECWFAKGLVAKQVLEGSLCPNSLNWLNYLLEEYPDHVVEFSTFSVDWGTLPSFNTVFWEVRKY